MTSQGFVGHMKGWPRVSFASVATELRGKHRGEWQFHHLPDLWAAQIHHMPRVAPRKATAQSMYRKQPGRVKNVEVIVAWQTSGNGWQWVFKLRDVTISPLNRDLDASRHLSRCHLRAPH